MIINIILNLCITAPLAVLGYYIMPWVYIRYLNYVKRHQNLFSTPRLFEENRGFSLIVAYEDEIDRVHFRDINFKAKMDSQTEYLVKNIFDLVVSDPDTYELQAVEFIAFVNYFGCYLKANNPNVESTLPRRYLCVNIEEAKKAVFIIRSFFLLLLVGISIIV